LSRTSGVRPTASAMESHAVAYTSQERGFMGRDCTATGAGRRPRGDDAPAFDTIAEMYDK
jgi:hypothetical protein